MFEKNLIRLGNVSSVVFANKNKLISETLHPNVFVKART